MITVDDEMKELILQGVSVGKLLEIARKKGLVTMKEDGLKKAALGHTTVEEVHRVVRVSEEQTP